jgi:hypothetical protein
VLHCSVQDKEWTLTRRFAELSDLRNHLVSTNSAALQFDAAFPSARWRNAKLDARALEVWGHKITAWLGQVVRHCATDPVLNRFLDADEEPVTLQRKMSSGGGSPRAGEATCKRCGLSVPYAAIGAHVCPGAVAPTEDAIPQVDLPRPCTPPPVLQQVPLPLSMDGDQSAALQHAAQASAGVTSGGFTVPGSSVDAADVSQDEAVAPARLSPAKAGNTLGLELADCAPTPFPAGAALASVGPTSTHDAKGAIATSMSADTSSSVFPAGAALATAGEQA